MGIKFWAQLAPVDFGVFYGMFDCVVSGGRVVEEVLLFFFRSCFLFACRGLLI